MATDNETFWFVAGKSEIWGYVNHSMFMESTPVCVAEWDHVVKNKIPNQLNGETIPEPMVLRSHNNNVAQEINQA